MRINLNADVGEGFGRYAIGDDRELLEVIGSANIACGMHAGDPFIMAATVRMALQKGVSLGAHPGFNDLWGFGRRPLRMDPADVESLVLYQIGALQAIARGQGARVTHVKPHGALNNLAHDDAALALAIGRAIQAADAALIFVVPAGSEMARAGERLGLRVAREAYADRRYDRAGRLLPRSHPEAVIRDPAQAAAHVLRMLDARAIFSTCGKPLPAVVDTLCIHGDEPASRAVALRVRDELLARGVQLLPLPALMDAPAATASMPFSSLSDPLLRQPCIL